jgi:hypothetical protein
LIKGFLTFYLVSPSPPPLAGFSTFSLPQGERGSIISEMIVLVLSAILAIPKNLKAVGGILESTFFAQSFQGLFDIFVREFDHLPAFETNHVFVMGMS